MDNRLRPLNLGEILDRTVQLYRRNFPVPWIALALFYNDQRVRKEGYDIEWMMQQAGLAPPQTAPRSAVGLGELSATAPLTAESGVFPQIPPPDNVGER
jgi:hypothetical protein